MWISQEDGTTGTFSLNRHLRKCTLKNDNTKTRYSYSNSLLEFNQVKSMKFLVEHIVGQEMPFSFVEYSGLKVF